LFTDAVILMVALGSLWAILVWFRVNAQLLFFKRQNMAAPKRVGYVLRRDMRSLFTEGETDLQAEGSQIFNNSVILR
jgi:hypothetical protein